MTKPALIFDLDGTLVDTAPDLCGALNAVLTANGRTTVPIGEVRHMVGRGARKLLERGFAFTGEPVSEADLDRHFEHFLDYYGAHIADESLPFPGAVDVLQRLGAAGHAMGVCTNKPEALSIALLDALDMGRHFGAVLGADSLHVRKPDPLHLLETIARIGGDPANAVMIGDSEVDAETAKRAGVPAIIFTFGYTALDHASLGADALLHAFEDLPAAIEAVAARSGRP